MNIEHVLFFCRYFCLISRVSFSNHLFDFIIRWIFIFPCLLHAVKILKFPAGYRSLLFPLLPCVRCNHLIYYLHFHNMFKFKKFCSCIFMSFLAHGNYFHFIGPLKSCSVHTKKLSFRFTDCQRPTSVHLSVHFIFCCERMESTNPRLPFGFCMYIHKQLSQIRDEVRKCKRKKRNEKINTLCKR